MKNLLLTGASGLIGKAVTKILGDQNYRIYPLARNDRSGPHYYLQASDKLHLDSSIPLHGVINLAGKNISERRWSKKYKKEIVESRIRLTRNLSNTIAQLPQRPEVFLSASAIGFYGTSNKQIFNETSSPGSDFLATLSKDWEKACMAAQEADIRTVLLRFGLVLSPDGGVLKNFLLPLRLACVGKIGNGQQMMSWIALHDVLKIINQLLINNEFSGPINLVSGQPVSNEDFSLTLAKTIRAVRIPPIPGALVRLLFGELADAALLPSAAVVSSRLQELGIELEYTNLQDALASINYS